MIEVSDDELERVNGERRRYGEYPLTREELAALIEKMRRGASQSDDFPACASCSRLSS